MTEKGRIKALLDRLPEEGPPRDPGFETLAVHAGARPDPVTGARATPIYQTTSYAFDDADHAAELFNLQTFGYIYSRLTNPTVAVLEERIAALEGGRGAVAVASGHAAQFLVAATLLEPGDEFVASRHLYGGSLTQFGITFAKLGWSCRFVDMTEPENVRAGDDRPGEVRLLRVARQPRRGGDRHRARRGHRGRVGRAARRRQHARLALAAATVQVGRRHLDPLDDQVHRRTRQHDGRHRRRVRPLRLGRRTTSSPA